MRWNTYLYDLYEEGRKEEPLDGNAPNERQKTAKEQSPPAEWTLRRNNTVTAAMRVFLTAGF